MPPQNKKHRISTSTAILMIAVALGYDGAQIATDYIHMIPVAGTLMQTIIDTLITVWAWLTFFVWFKLQGISFINPKRALALNGGGLLEIIPILNSLPAWTLAVILIIGSTRTEELLEKAGPLGTLASKALAAKTQGGLSVARSQKSEAEKVRARAS